jgi:hypothetical protein
MNERYSFLKISIFFVLSKKEVHQRNFGEKTSSM